jgi:heme/copper-type cytochrome/quinol oxidase subunit 2
MAGGLLAGLALTGCTSAPEATAGPSPAVTSATPTPATSASASSSASATPTPSPSETSAAADSVTIDITIADGQVTPNGKKINIEVGQAVVLNVTSDEHDAIHAHTEGDGYELEVPAGKKVTGKFEINSPGSYEVESHHLEKVIVILNAR